MGLGVPRRDQAVLDAVFGAAPVEKVCWPVGSRSPWAVKRSVKALPLSVRSFWIVKGAAATRASRKARAESAV